MKVIATNLMSKSPKKTPININALKFTGSFEIPEKLYGRDDEIATISHEIASLTKTKKKSIIFVSGISGVGKTELVKEVNQGSCRFSFPYFLQVCQGLPPSTLFISAKADQRTNSAYFLIRRALSTWLEFVGDREDYPAELWAQAILEATMPDTKVLFDIFPELSRLLPNVPETITGLVVCYSFFVYLLYKGK